MSAFKIGDVVELKSGSPKMTIVDTQANVVRCLWFNSKGATESNNFDTRWLKKIQE